MPTNYLLQILFLLTILSIEAKKPPGYVEPPKEYDPNPPKYEYGYKIVDEAGKSQEKAEKRDGIYAQGRYSVQNTDSSQDVQYFADDWGYHPVVEYSSIGPHSRSQTKFALGEEAVKQLKDKENGLSTTELPKSTQQIQEDPSNQILVQQQSQQPQQSQPQQLDDDANKNSGAILPQAPQQQQQLIIPTQQVQIVDDPSQNQQQVLVQTQDPQQTIVHQPQQVFVQQQTPDQQQQLFVGQQHPQQIFVQQQSPDQPQQLFVAQEQPQQILQPQIENVQPVLLQGEQYNQPQAQFLIGQQPKVGTVNLVRQGIGYENRVIHENQGNDIRPNVLLEKSDTRLEFGAKLNNVQLPNKLIESTRNLVSDQDLLNLNGVVTKGEDVIETSTLNSLLHSYVTPTIASLNIKQQPSDIVIYSTTPSPTIVSEVSLDKEPIVAAELNENSISSSTERSFVTSTVATITGSTPCDHDSGSTTVLVTPRPVGPQFLAPITAGVQLETTASEQNQEEAQQIQQIQQNDKVLIEVQKSLPYYLGKFEYPTAYAQAYTQNINNSAELKASEDIELGKTLLMFPGDFRQSSHQTVIHHTVPTKQNVVEIESNHLSTQQLPEEQIKTVFADQLQIQGQQVEQYVQQPVVQENQLQYILQNSLNAQQKAQQNLIEGYNTRVIHHSYPYEVPYPIVKQVQVPVTIQKVVEKPVHITQYVEKPVPVPRPYPVEKIIEKPIHIPVQVTKYVDRPYPVEVRVPVPQPYPVEKVVEKIVRQPYPVEVKVPVQVPVEKIVEKKIPVPQYIEKQVAVEKIVEKPVPHFVDRPYPVEVKVPVPIPTAYVFPVAIQKSYNTKTNGQISNNNIQILPAAQQQVVKEQYTQQSQQLGYYYPNPYSYAPQVNQYLPPRQDIKLTKAYLPPKLSYSPPRINNEYLPPNNCDNQGQHSQKNVKYAIKTDDYIGLLPPRADLRNLRKFRAARSNSFDESSIRLEYGFMPPLIPSLEIDEFGQPIEKDKK